MDFSENSKFPPLKSSLAPSILLYISVVSAVLSAVVVPGSCNYIKHMTCKGIYWTFQIYQIEICKCTYMYYQYLWYLGNVWDPTEISIYEVTRLSVYSVIRTVGLGKEVLINKWWFHWCKCEVLVMGFNKIFWWSGQILIWRGSFLLN